MASLTSVLVVLHVVVVAVVVRLLVFPVHNTGILSPNVNTSYDYVIVGAGTAGSVLASRLSEEGHVTVLLIEAGGDDRNQPLISVPFYQPLTYRTKFDWEYFTEPQQNSAQGLDERRSFWPRGKGLGGSSTINGMLYVRGHRHDYDSWASNGCEGWSYKDVLPYFKRSEDFNFKGLENSEYHGTDGPLAVTKASIQPVSEQIMRAGLELGYKEVDVNGDTQEGFAYTQVNIRNGERMSTSKAFVWPVINRPNLHVLTNSHVSKVLIENKKAVGVEYIKDGRLYRVRSSREVILSAGAVGSPQLLMLSGIGPRKHLTDLGIHVVADLPVGDNLQDHVMTVIRSPIKQPLSITPQKSESFMSHLEYKLFGTGYLSSNIGLEVFAFVKTKEAERSPDAQLHFFSFMIAKAYGAINFDKQVAAKIDWPIAEGFAVAPTLLRPKSVGTIRLKSSNPFEYPAIDPNYFSHPDDVKTLIRAIRIFQKMYKTKSFKDMGAEPDSAFPTCTSMTFDSDEYWECYIRSISLTVYHPVGTCKMGPSNDKTAVVDPELRVKGISGLRVADASIMPAIVSGNTNAPAIMIGEKAADMIRKR